MKSLLCIVYLCVGTWGMLIAASAQALAFRCNSYVIDVGMHKAEVIQKCGIPASRDQRLERRRVSVIQSQSHLVSHSPVLSASSERSRGSVGYEREVDIQIEEWIYNFGPQRFMQLLIFEDGRLKSIQDLAYGQ